MQSMPTIYRFEGFRFFFYSNEGNEPPHIHISKNDNEMKVWLHSLGVEFNFGFKKSEVRILLKIVKNNQKRFLLEWEKFYE